MSGSDQSKQLTWKPNLRVKNWQSRLLQTLKLPFCNPPHHKSLLQLLLSYNELPYTYEMDELCSPVLRQLAFLWTFITTNYRLVWTVTNQNWPKAREQVDTTPLVPTDLLLRSANEVWEVMFPYREILFLCLNSRIPPKECWLQIKGLSVYAKYLLKFTC